MGCHRLLQTHLLKLQIFLYLEIEQISFACAPLSIYKILWQLHMVFSMIHIPHLGCIMYFLFWTFVMTLQCYFQSKYIVLYACVLLCKNGPNVFAKESKCNTRDPCPLFEHLSNRRTWQQSIYKIKLHLECSLDAFFYIHSIKINVQNQCIILFSLESQCSHIKHIL